MRVTMVYTNRNPYLCPAPLGALHVTARLEEAGHDVDFVDLMHAKDPHAALRAALGRHRPELVALSIRNVDNQQMDGLDHPLDDIAPLAKTVRAASTAPLLLGGTAVTTFPTQIRAMLGADYAFAGDDSAAAARFVSSLAAGAPDLATPGLVYEDAAGVHANPFEIKGYSDTRFGGWGHLDLRKYRKGYYDSGVVTCTGCPHGCSFCDAHRTFGRTHRPRDPRLVVEELRELQDRHKAKSVFLVNSGLNYPLEAGKELLRRMIEARLRLPFTCILEPGPLDAEMATLLYRANCASAMLFGTSLDDAVLERNQPHYRRADVLRMAGLLDDARVPYFLGLMFGGPGETLRMVEDTLEASLAMKPVMLVSGVGFRIQWDTPLYDIAVAEGRIAPGDDAFTARFYMPEEAPAAAVHDRLRRFRRAHPLRRLRMVGYVLRTIKEGMFGRA